VKIIDVPWTTFLAAEVEHGSYVPDFPVYQPGDDIYDYIAACLPGRSKRHIYPNPEATPVSVGQLALPGLGK
jgi:hypothetical protein